MEHLQELLTYAAKQAELELQLPQLRTRQTELKEAVSDLKIQRDWAWIEAKNLEEPGFFQRLMGNIAEKQEKAQAEARQATAAYDEAMRELDEVTYQLEIQENACANLSGSRDAYDLARKTFLLTADSEAADQLS